METSTSQHVLRAIAESLGRPEDDVTPGTKLVELADSLEVAHLVLDLELEFNIEITDDDLKKIFTVEDIVKYVDTRSH